MPVVSDKSCYFSISLLYFPAGLVSPGEDEGVDEFLFYSSEFSQLDEAWFDCPALQHPPDPTKGVAAQPHVDTFDVRSKGAVI